MAVADDDWPGATGSYLFKFLGVQAIFGPGTFVPGLAFKTGPHSVGAHALYLNFSPATGEVVSITNLRIAATFDKHFQTATANFFMSIYVCPTFVTCPDPLTTPPTVPESPTRQPFTLQRIR